MKIEKLFITNFKGVENRTEINFGDLNVIVGQNDIGKSTISKALDFYFNKPNPSQDDCCHKSNNNIIEFELHLKPNETSVVIDQAIETTLESEGLVNNEGNLQLRRTIDVTNAKPKVETFITRKVYDQHDHILLTEAQLITLCRELDIETSKANGDEFNNVEKRLKIREYIEANNIGHTFEEVKIPATGSGRLKSIGNGLNKSLPRFEYFKADTSLSESDASIQNYFKKLSEATINENVNTEEVEQQVSDAIGSVLTSITNKINDVVDAEEDVVPNIKFDWTKLIQITFQSKDDDQDLPLKSRGDGFRRLTMMSYFEHLAEIQKTEAQNVIFGFEEPETFLHPSGQENLFSKLKGLCDNGYQVIASTHSSIVVSNSPKESLIHITKPDGVYTVDQNIEDLTGIANDLGITVDNQFIRLFDNAEVLVLVEGISDATALNHMSRTYYQAGTISECLTNQPVAIIPIGGCDSVKHWVTLNLLGQLNKPYFIFQDSDKNTESEISPNLTKLTNMGFTINQDFYITKRKNIENYISSNGINRLVSGANLIIEAYSDVKTLSKQNQFAGALGGKGIFVKHFESLNYAELRETLFDGQEDEFLIVYDRIQELLN